MTPSDGTGPSMMPLTNEVPNHALPVADDSGSESDQNSLFLNLCTFLYRTFGFVGSLDTSRASNRAYNNNTLPVEILIYIFTLASAAYPSIFDDGNQALWRGRLTLAAIVSVCRLWRSAALGAQSLWSTIVLPCGSKHIQKCLKTSLCYSNKLDVDIFYFLLPGRKVYDDETHKIREHYKILDILFRNDASSRLRTLSNIPVCSLASKTHQLRRVVRDLLKNTNQTIQAVEVRHWEHSTRRDSTPLELSTTVELLGCLSANIRELSITRPVHDSDHRGMMEFLASPTLQIFWGRLSHLRITGPHCVYLAEAAEIFRKCVSLEKIQVHCISGRFFEGDNMYGPLFGEQRLLLPHLRQLIIQSFSGDMTWLLDAISCPSIVSLAIKQDTTIFEEDEDHAACMRLESFIQRSFSISPSPKGVLHEMWVHGLSTCSIEYLLSSHVARSVRSIALARRVYTLRCPEWWHSDSLLVPPLDLHDIYVEAAQEYGLSVSDMLERYETVPWYGWNRSVVPLRLSAFAIQCLDKIIIHVDTSTHVDTDIIVDSDQPGILSHG